MSKLVQEAVQTRKRVREISEANEAPIATRKAKTESEPKVAAKGAATSKSKAVGSKKIVPKKVAGEKKQKSSSVIYLGHIPHGFYEREISKFFSQFGEIKQLKLFRSQKTNGSKGYAFIKFSDPEVAVVSAEAMNGYFLNDRKLVCHVVAPEKLHKGMFAKPKQTAKTSANGGSDSGEADFEEDDEEEDEVVDKEKAAKKAEKMRKDMQKKMKRLAELGIDYEFTPSVSK
jgi:nucleolar protein 15